MKKKRGRSPEENFLRKASKVFDKMDEAIVDLLGDYDSLPDTSNFEADEAAKMARIIMEVLS